jgi:hypothetical protein
MFLKTESDNIYQRMRTHLMAFERYCRWLAKYLILSPSFRASLTGNDALFASARPVN